MKAKHSILSILLVLTPLPALAHDGKTHAGKAINGTVSSVASDSFELATGEGSRTVTYSTETIFEHNGRRVDSKHLAVGTEVTVHALTLPGGTLGADEVLIGAPPQKAPTGNDHATHPRPAQ